MGDVPGLGLDEEADNPMRRRRAGPSEGEVPRARPGWIGRSYGRKQALVRSLYHGLLDRSGRYATLHRIDWRPVARLVFVCQGNICRSAYAEARARAMGIEATSFGLGTQGGDPSPPLMVQLAAEAGLDLTAHRSRSPEAAGDLCRSDLVLAMEPAHLGRLGPLVPEHVPVTLLGLWAGRRRPHIEDPYGLDPDYFRTCIRLIDEAVAAVAGRLDGRVMAGPGAEAGPAPGRAMGQDQRRSMIFDGEAS